MLNPPRCSSACLRIFGLLIEISYDIIGLADGDYGVNPLTTPISCLLYADDVTLIADIEAHLSHLVNTIMVDQCFLHQLVKRFSMQSIFMKPWLSSPIEGYM